MSSMSGGDDTVYLEKRGGRQGVHCLRQGTVCGGVKFSPTNRCVNLQQYPYSSGCYVIPCSGKRLTHFSRGSEWPSECSCFNRLKLFPAAGINFQKIVLFV